MNEKFLPYMLLLCALGLSGTAAYYSVYGLSIIFSGVAIPVIIMGTFLEISKMAIATYLHDSWSKIYGVLKTYLTLALVVLSILTSIGIYGLLSTGFQKSIAGLEISNKKVENIEVKKKRYEETKGEYLKEKKSIDKDITSLRNALSTNTTTQTIDRQSGQVITRANAGNRRAFEQQLVVAQESKNELTKKIDAINDSITKLDIEVLPSNRKTKKQSLPITGNGAEVNTSTLTLSVNTHPSVVVISTVYSVVLVGLEIGVEEKGSFKKVGGVQT